MANAILFEGGGWSHAQLRARVAGWKQWLHAQGLGPNARVGVLAANRPDTVALFLACGELQMVLVPFNARLTARELAPLVAAAAPNLVLADDARIPSARPFPAIQPAVDLPFDPAADDQPLAALFTSGTTGTPSLIVLTHGNFRASARASAANLGASPDQRWLLCLPLFHVGGLAMAHRCAQYGATLVVEPGFDPDRVNALIDSGDVTHLSLVATALDRLLDQRRLPSTALGMSQGQESAPLIPSALEGRPFPATLRAVLVGGGPVPQSLLDRARSLGARVLQTYGLTEACSQVTTERPADADGSTAGPALWGTEVRIVDGQIEVRGPTVAPQFGSGWLQTKDLGQLDARGRLTVLSRRTDLIVSGGENVYPAELERILSDHPAIREIALGPREDPRWGQVPVALVVWRNGRPSEDALIGWCRSQLAGFKIPRAFISAESLPRNANGKVDRAALRALIA